MVNRDRQKPEMGLHRQVRCTRREIRSAGFSIIELMMVLAIAVLMLSIGMPMFNDFRRDMQARSTMGALGADIHLARSEAVKRNARMLFCARAAADSQSCIGTPATGAWMNGWLVCFDRDADGVCDAGSDADRNPVKIQPGLQAPMSLVGPAATLTMFPVGSISANAVFTVSGGSDLTFKATVQPSGSVVVTKAGG